MVAEVARRSRCGVDDAAEMLLGLSPYDMQSLLIDVISGKERQEDQSMHTLPGPSSSLPLNKRSEAETFVHQTEFEESTLNLDLPAGLWLRRRKLDGALNRVPVNFYTYVWAILERCPGVWVRGYCLPQALTKEMTPGEIKFALRVEEMLNRVPEPEYRQLLVEALMVLSLAVEHDAVHEFKVPIDVESVVQRANGLFLDDQRQCKGDATLCCASSTRPCPSPCQSAVGVCEHFYDSAPSGAYGTMTYLMRAIACIPDVNASVQDCVLS